MLTPKHGTAPIVVNETPGKKWYCQCGLSATLPYCDGAHKATDIRPIAVVIEAECKKAVCQCRCSTKLPWCDGSHKHLKETP